MLASFWAIYRRGRFSSRELPDDEQMQQRERFGVACLALCLQNDEEFCANFVRSIGGVESSPSGWAVSVDPYHWADMLFQCGNYSIVVECKINDRLEPKQDPWHASRDFETSGGGYGACFSEKFPGHTRVYAVLKATKREGEVIIQGTRCRNASWADLSRLNLPASRWVRDLFLTLANLGYPHFRHMKTTNLHVNNIKEVLACHEMLDSVAMSLGLANYRIKHSAIKETMEGEITDGHIGVEITAFRSNQTESNCTKIDSMIDPKSKYKAWFGYALKMEAPSLSQNKLSVWFYCGSSKAAKAVVKQLGTVPGWEKISMDKSADISEKDYLHFVKSPRERMSDADEFRAFISRIIPLVG